MPAFPNLLCHCIYYVHFFHCICFYQVGHYVGNTAQNEVLM